MVGTLGLKMLHIEPGTFRMGCDEGDRDERPVHQVTLPLPFWMAATPVTNAQYEQFDPAHRALRGKRGLSSTDDEAVVYVSWPAAKDPAFVASHEGRATAEAITTAPYAWFSRWSDTRWKKRGEDY